MHTISKFYGIIIRMFYKDNAPPHFHAIYGEYELSMGISPIRILEGEAPNRMHSMILEWSALHQEELLDNWERCQNAQTPLPIEPLK
jgi:hypothetical protein